ncbi:MULTISPECIES: SDR family oxidoreductase [Fusobacterium]|uniref:SDR family NAD(P)-dependent oxidoreductase n=1 Tax=Fusobacterium TaxID=848 RepID=UPI00147748AF|nr:MULTISPECIES: SDR family NAD(P)-dependent oxidoreductase [Fusobacterium]NME35291.1 SDR family NAD(P)-dependent oxidoreductase [Fusobacterium sp. FSA-380-WT-3A]
MNILITGVTKGIGYQLVSEFVKRNHKVFGIGRTEEKLLELKTKYGENFIPLNYDITLEENIEKIFKVLDENSISIDILINNAGIGFLGEFYNIDYKSNEKMIDLNIKSLMHITYKFINKSLEENIEKIRGIINISSTAAFQSGGPYFAVYYGTKAFVSSFTNGITEELRDKNFKVMGVYPGPTKTEFVGMEKEKSFYTMEAKKVAKIIVQDFFNEKEISIPGFFNKILVFIGKVIPRKLELKFLKKIQLKKLK